MKNNKLTLKTLKKELDLMKVQDLSNKKALDQEIKNSYIKNLHLKLRENSMLLLYVLSGIIGYIHKIPFIGRIISFLSLYYGRTTIWQILVKIRKSFILLNALIGVIMVFHTVGFSTDNVLAGITGMGHEYLQMLYNFTHRLFNWFVELFDHKVVPNVPNEPKNPKSFIPKFTKPDFIPTSPLDRDVFNPFSKEKLNKDHFSLRDLYTKPSINITIDSNPWYKDISTWLWIGGGLCTIVFIYSGYKFLTDPTFIETLFSANTSSTATPINPGDNTPTPDITLSDKVTKSIVSAYSVTIKKLNPFNWFTSSTDIKTQFQNFMNKQNDMVTADRRFYPFTEINPYLPWYKQLKTHLIGESVSESLERFKDRTIAERVYNSLQVSKGKFTDVTAATPLLTPTPNNWIGSVGIKTPTIGSGMTTPNLGFNIFDQISSETIQNRLNSLTPTPNNVPSLSDDNLMQIGGRAADWITNNDPSKIASSSTIPSHQNLIPVHNNPFDLLIEEII
jgi:hypothetical protein